ncbi:hydantoinase/oxoprolinase family protein [Nocardiopsis composta]
MEPLARALGTDVEGAARAVLDKAVERVAEAVEDLVRAYGLDRSVCTLVGEAAAPPPSPRTSASTWASGPASPRTAR